MKVPAIYLINYLKPIAIKHGLDLKRWSDICKALELAAKLN
jgi:hypothetical protein